MDSKKQKLSLNEDTRDGAQGFSPQYSGNGIASLSETSSFDVQAGGNDMATRSEGSGTVLIVPQDKKRQGI